MLASVWLLQEADVGGSVAAEWGDVWILYAWWYWVQQIKLRGLLEFQGFQYFLFSLKKDFFFTQVEASVIAINVHYINFLNFTVQIVLQLNETREKGMCN